MGKCFIFATFAILNLFVSIEAAPSTFGESLFERPVRYDGDQVWNVEVPQERDMRVLINLNKKLG